jgi:uncharacterized protein (UPF0276 family)
MTITSDFFPRPYLGIGLGLRPDHYKAILDNKPDIDWFEIVTENYLIPGGKPLYYLHAIREHYPVVMHGVSLSIGSTDPIDWDYLKSLKELAKNIAPVWISDHLCWTGVGGVNMHDLMPMPYTQQAIRHIADKIRQVQDYLGRRILIENVSSYLTYKQSEMTEWEFLSEVAEQSDCLILFDVNNIYVSAVNHGFDPQDYYQIHLAGHSRQKNYIIDTHDAPVIEPVWQLYAETIKHFGAVSTMIERDDNIPLLEELLEETAKARQILREAVQEPSLA